MARPLNARAVIQAITDPGTFTSWDNYPQQPDLGEEYAQDLKRAAEASGESESVVTGLALVRGRPLVLVVSEFGFLAGSIGAAAADRITSAVARATREGLPLLASPASGGTRMQEGTPAFLAMLRVTAAVRRHRDAGLPYLVYLRHPTTGGVMASWGSLGHLTAAEPGALLGFLGPRVYAALTGDDFPTGVQQAENLFRHGLIDAVRPPQEMGEVIDRTLDILQPVGASGSVVPGPVGAQEAVGPRAATESGTAKVGAAQPDTAESGLGEGLGDGPVWPRVVATRDLGRPGAEDLVNLGAAVSVGLSGTAEGENDPGILLALARFGQSRCIVLGHRRMSGPVGHGMGPGALRAARRGVGLAAELSLPVVCLIDTSGAALSVAAEQGGLAAEIARSLDNLLSLPGPSVSVLLGEGTGGGALALLPADRVIAAENAWLAPLPPEGSASLLHGTVAAAPQAAQAQRIGARDLVSVGLVDRIVPEPVDPAQDPKGFLAAMVAAIEAELAIAAAQPSEGRVERRMSKVARLGR
ncbi:MAG: carboxyl transferase domain-containing protein [Actinomycetales bacterium]